MKKLALLAVLIFGSLFTSFIDVLLGVKHVSSDFIPSTIHTAVVMAWGVAVWEIAKKCKRA